MFVRVSSCSRRGSVKDLSIRQIIDKRREERSGIKKVLTFMSAWIPKRDFEEVDNWIGESKQIGETATAR